MKRKYGATTGWGAYKNARKRRKSTAKRANWRRRIGQIAGAASGGALGFIGGNLPGAYIGARAGWSLGGRSKAGKTRRRVTPPNVAANRGSKTVTTLKRKTPAEKFRKKRWVKFCKKVDLAVDKEKPRGVVTMTRRVNLQQLTADKWSIQENDQNGTRMELFTPKMIKDAEGICFNAKAFSQNSFNNFTTLSPLAIGTNFGPRIVTRIVNSYVKMRFKNCSQHTTTVEMYLMKGKVTKNGYNQDPIVEWDQNITSTVFGDENDFATFGTQFWHHKAWSTAWEYKKIVFNLVPGAEETHFIQGPKNMEWQGTNHLGNGSTLTVPVWFGPEIKGNGMLMAFRTITHPTIDTAGIVHRLPHAHAGATWGGVALEYSTVWIMKPPFQVTGGGTDDQRMETAQIIDDLLTVHNDQQIDEDNPATVITGPF